jgi:hypothetical protein
LTRGDLLRLRPGASASVRAASEDVVLLRFDLRRDPRAAAVDGRPSVIGNVWRAPPSGPCADLIAQDEAFKITRRREALDECAGTGPLQGLTVQLEGRLVGNWPAPFGPFERVKAVQYPGDVYAVRLSPGQSERFSTNAARFVSLGIFAVRAPGE